MNTLNPQSEIRNPKSERVVVGLSGGVDSSVAALLLKQSGYEVIGITLKVWLGDCSEAGDHSCCGPRAVEDARSVAYELGIPFYVIDHKQAFQENVVDYFIKEYARGRTPNPCVVCNRVLKFGSMLELAEKLGATKLATGHYARVEEENGKFLLKKAADLRKDQSYFLYTLDQYKLGRVLFPLGTYTKTETREIARKAGLKVFDKTDSQEICFVPEGQYVDFLKKAVPDQFHPGLIKDTQGRILGEHTGIQQFTIGQRKGLGIALGKPTYVVRLEGDSNTVVVGTEEDLLSGEFDVGEVHWILGEVPSHPVYCSVKIRYNHPAVGATIHCLGKDRAHVVFEKPERAVAPGQAAVFYERDCVLGGGIIE